MRYLITVFICCAFALLSCDPKTDPPDKVIKLDSLPSLDKNSYASADQSPMDMSYHPSGYPLQKMAGKDSSASPIARVIYSRPHKKGRQVFGNNEKSLCRYGRPWRLGANEATEIEFFRPVRIAGKDVPAGRYVIYCIPYADHWTIVMNKNLYTWGLHMDTTKDFLKVDIVTMELNPALEDFTMVFLPSDVGTELLMAWDNVKAILPIMFPAETGKRNADNADLAD